VTLLFADEARGWLPASLVSMGLMSQRWSVLVAAILLIMKKSLVQILEAPLAGFTHIGQESFEKRLEVPSTSRAIVGMKTLGLLIEALSIASKLRTSSASVRTVPVALVAAVVIRHVAISIENADDWPVHLWMRCTASSILGGRSCRCDRDAVLVVVAKTCQTIAQVRSRQSWQQRPCT